ncbi:PHD finger protein ING1 [Fusarium oxysporum f. sp. rapae]|uniref:PHD finger protein ING1 n=1 Tax=Fusarium oxysporum f. sp. rapae TaxID=485398 RepID=A0A8J5P8P1_FUSOX|nr:PHD finger protein ING1 [Fusarium oxysporum f. sp. rapae]
MGEGTDLDGDTNMEAISPTTRTLPLKAPSLERIDSLASMESRVDPDAQTTVTDFLDFTDYLPSDIVRSLTLIGQLDQTYANASHKVHDLTAIWGRLPTLPQEERPAPVQLRADISEQLELAINSRTFAHAEAIRMSENINRHYAKARVLFSKLRKMRDNYPTEEPNSPVQSKSPQLARSKAPNKAAGDGQKPRRPQVPRIIVPGEIQAPYDLDYDSYTDESEVSSDEDSDTPAPNRRTPAPGARIKVVTTKPPKTPNRLARPVTYATPALSQAAAANNAALLQPPPEDAVVGSPDAPWLQLTQYELAKLRKRMKKNATWTPSETMIARELKALGRGPDAYHEAKKKAEDEGESFEPPVPKPVVDSESGEKQLPAGAMSVEVLEAEEVPTSNRGMKLNEAKKLKRDRDLAKMAAEEAEESARKMNEAARKMNEAAKLFLGNGNNNNSNNNGNQATPKTPTSETPKETPKPAKTRAASRSTKRKREPEPEEPNNSNESAEKTESQSLRPQAKRAKTETPVPPPPQLTLNKGPSPEQALSAPTAPGGLAAAQHAQTPVPIPIPGRTTRGSVKSPTPSPATASATGPSKPPPQQTPVPLPLTETRKSVTPVLPPVRENSKRETRGEAAKRTQQAQQQAELPPPQVIPPIPEISEEEPLKTEQNSSPAPQLQHVQIAPPPPPSLSQLAPEAASKTANKQVPSRAPTPRLTPGPEGLAIRRPSSRGKAASQEPQPSLAVDRPRRASTARNTPAPEPRPPKRTKRPAPGIVSTTKSGGNSAVGKRKAPPKKKARAKKDKGSVEVELEDVDDDGNPIDPDEPKYCLCNRVSFGTMIACENADYVSDSTASNTYLSSSTARKKQTDIKLTNQQCKQEWFHLECVGLEEVPARTTKWYCPECRIKLNIGEKGEVSARGVKK